MAALEQGLEGLVVSAGSAAVNYAIGNIVEPGTNIVSVPQLYGATYTLLAHVFRNQGVEARFAASDAPEAVAALIDDQTRAVYCESVGNPAGNVADIEGLAEVAHARDVPLIVDNTVATPILLKPIAHGADIVLHSLTKFAGGHGTSLGGVIVDGGRFPWERHKRRYPMLTTPEPSYHDVVYTEKFGDAAYIARCRTVGLRNSGATLSPFNAFLILQGVETLPLRMERHDANARAVAEFLRNDRRVAWANYVGFPDNPYHDLARKYLSGRFPSLLTFGVKGGFDVGRKVYNRLRMFKRLVNMGDCKSLASHPASTTHRQIPRDDLHRFGITPEMIRLSVGIEDVEDIIGDLSQALEAADG
jgi:O-acetylhomoserine (thiol)-lyase